MNDRFALRFVLADGRPTLEQVQSLWPDGPAVHRQDDGVLQLRDDERVWARVDLLGTDDARGKAILQALERTARQHGTGEALESVLFVLDAASAVVIAMPEASNDAELEQAMEPLDQLWEFLFEEFGGVLQVDGEGIHGEEGALIAVA
ncbi:MAG: hypothetical protein AB8H79_06140 [Myxococcota bacterium]